MSKIILILPFVFLFIGIFTVIYIIYTTINEKRRKKLRDEEFKKIKETLFSYEFESTQKNAVNKNFDFENYLYSGDYVKVIKTFKDYDGFTHTVGEKWYFACQYFLQSEYGDVLYISTDKINIDTIYLEDREDNLYAHPEEYFKILEQGRFKKEVF